MKRGRIIGRLCCTVFLLIFTGDMNPVEAATEVYIDGSFRMRGWLFDNLFLQREVDLADSSDPSQVGSDGTSTYIQQRFRLEPELRVNQYLSVFSQFDFLPDLTWGTNPERLSDPGGYYDPIGYSQSFSLSGDEESPPLVAPRRLWAECYTKLGRFKLGRTGMHVGSGIYFNDGNGMDADYPGDTADRVQFLTKLGRVYVLLGYDMIYEGDRDRPYDSQAGAAAVAYRSELISGSIYTYYQDDRSWIEEGNPSGDSGLRNNMKTWTFDLWGKSLVGPVEVELEAIYRYGGGDGSRLVYESADAGVDPRVLENMVVNSFGGMARMKWTSRRWNFGVETGLATGDADPPYSDSDRKLNEFEFDRNYHLGLMLFRTPMPARASLYNDESVNDIYEAAIVGSRISNAYYLVPSVELNILTHLQAEVQGVMAWALKPTVELNNSKKYGYEFDVGLKSQLYDKLTLALRGGMFVPGEVFGDGKEFAFGAELMAIVEF